MVDRSPMSLSDIKARLQALGDSASMVLYRAAKSIDRTDGDGSESINGKEWSIFETAAKGMVRDKRATVQEYESIFGAGSYKEEEPPKPKAPAAPADTTKTKKPEAGNDSIPRDTVLTKKIADVDVKKSPRPSGKDAYAAGNELYHILDGNTDDYMYDRVNEIIDSEHLDKDNVMKILEGFYAAKSHEGLIEMLDDEWDGGAILMDNKKNIIASLIQHAREKGFGNDADVQNLQRLFKQYTTGNLKDATDFNNNGWTKFNHNRGSSIASGFVAGAATGATWGLVGGPLAPATSLGGAIGGAIVGAVAGAMDRVTDNEVIDELMKKIYTKIKNPKK